MSEALSVSPDRRAPTLARKDIDGILVLDKALGISSNRALQQVKHLLRARKAGHSGSLDPLASGVLPLFFGEATKVAGIALEADKTYIVKLRLGVTTTTGDAEGEILEQRPVPELTDDQLRSAVASFVGKIAQTPPMYSALKHQGRPLYEYARRGETIDRPARTIYIHSAELLSRAVDEIELKVACSKGTYIRTLVEDIGKVLGCGASVTALRRTVAGPFALSDALSVEELEQRIGAADEIGDGILRPMDSVLTAWPAINLSEDVGAKFCRGQAIRVEQVALDGLVRVYGREKEFFGFGAVSAGVLHAKRVVHNEK